MLLPLSLSFSLFLQLTAPLNGVGQILPSLDSILPSLSNLLLYEGRIQTFDGRSADVGSNYEPGTFTNVPLEGGSGSGALATVVVGASGSVTGLTLTTFGRDYQPGDTLTINDATLGGGTGFQIDVAGVASTLPRLDAVLPTLDPCSTIDPPTGECRPAFVRQ